jgi:hypothetical protein
MVTNVVVIVIEAEKLYVVLFFWLKRFGMQTVRVPVKIKHTCEGRKIPFIKMPVIIKLKRIQRTEIKFNGVQEINLSTLQR